MRVAVRQPRPRLTHDSVNGGPAPSGGSSAWPTLLGRVSGRGSGDGGSGLLWRCSDDVGVLLPSADGSLDSMFAPFAAPPLPPPLAPPPPLRVPLEPQRTSLRLSGDGVLVAAPAEQVVSGGSSQGGGGTPTGGKGGQKAVAATARKKKASHRGPGRPRGTTKPPTPKKAAPVGPPPPTQSSADRGVSRHRSTRRWEASIWLAGRQVYLGGFEEEEDAARAYDVAALAVRGARAPTNFDPSCYSADLATLSGAPPTDVVAHLRRRSAAFARGRSPFRGVSGGEGRWEARIGVLRGRKNVSLGLHDTEENAARAYDRSLIVERGRTAKTNFAVAEYDAEVEAAAGQPSGAILGARPLRPAAAEATVRLGQPRDGLARG